jgi:hypothetical protein
VKVEEPVGLIAVGGESAVGIDPKKVRVIACGNAGGEKGSLVAGAGDYRDAGVGVGSIFGEQGAAEEDLLASRNGGA